jgi:hypothetical protein
MLGQLSENSAQYIAGYVTKKMTRFDDHRLLGRYPEFSRMSLRPGLGANAMHDVASVLMQYNLEETLPDVPGQVRIGSRKVPIGRYLRQQLRSMVGHDKASPEVSLHELEAKLCLVRQAAFNSSRSVKSVFNELNQPYSDQISARLTMGKQSETF